MKHAKSISVLIPAFNESDLLSKTVNSIFSYLEKLHLSSFEVIICVNGCTDDTEVAAKRLTEKYSCVSFVSITERGFGLALNEGIRHASKEIVAFLPGDGEINPSFIGRALALMDDYDFILGSRYLGGGRKSFSSSLFRGFLSLMFSLAFRLCFNHGLSEVGTVKMFKRDWAVERLSRLSEPNFAWQLQILYEALHDNLRIAEVPAEVRIKRSSGQSKVRVFSDSLSLLLICLRCGFRLWFFG